jgi:transmembrane sensor
MKEPEFSDSLIEAIDAYFSGSLKPRQAEELMEWIKADAGNMSWFRDIGTIWYLSGHESMKKKDAGKGWIKLLDRIRQNGIRKMPSREIRIRVSMVYRTAAVLLILITLGIGSYFFYGHSHPDGDHEFFEATAPKGSRSYITLYDGSKVWLNSGTKLRIRRNFGHTDRTLFLEGEAYFVVAHNRSLPFRVNTSDIVVTATGTAFNVKAYAEENIIETTLENGEVRIDEVNQAKAGTNTTPVYLKPNQIAVFIKSTKNTRVNDTRITNGNATVNSQVKETSSPHLKVDSMVDTKLTTSWKDNRWIFKSSKLQDLAPILERRFNISITFRDSVLSDYKFTGIIKDESLEQVLNAISLAAPVRYEINHKQVILSTDRILNNAVLKTNK